MFRPTDIASLVYFRIAFGLLMVWEVWRFFAHGWIATKYIEPGWHFTYLGFSWVQPWPGNGMYVHFAILGGAALCMALGLAYRLAAAVFCTGFVQVFLLEKAEYLNHFYLISLVSLLMVFVPAHRAFSIDTWLRPRLRTAVVPAWPLWMLRTQMGLVYVFAAVAKMNGDWLNGWPMRLWLAERWEDPLVGTLFQQEWAPLAFSWAGLLIDLLAVPLLLWRRTRLLMFVLLLAFHCMNKYLFDIGVFPWLSIAITLLFFSPSWPRRLPGLVHPLAAASLPAPGRLVRVVVPAVLAIWFAAQIAIPLRHWFYPGDVAWTEEGHRFSWRMKLRSKSARAVFHVTVPGRRGRITVDPRRYLSARQAQKMSTRPYMIVQFAHHIADDWRRRGHPDVEVRARVMASLNGRDAQLLVDPEVDLARQPRTFFARADWIVPLVQERWR